RRHDGEKALDIDAFQRVLEDGDVLLQRGLALVFYGSHGDDGAALRKTLGREIFGIEFGKFRAVFTGANRRHHLALLDAGEAVEYIERPGAELAIFAVADDVDAGLLLPAHDVVDRLLQKRVEGGHIDLEPLLDRLDIFDE